MVFETNMFNNCNGLFICIATWMNSITQGAFWTLFLLAFIIVVFMASYRYGTTRAFAFATTSGSFGTLAFSTIGLIPWSIAVFFFVANAIGLVALYLSNKE